jgi:hypothetical protein
VTRAVASTGVVSVSAESQKANLLGGKHADEMSDQAVLLLRKQLKELSRNPIEGFSAGLVDDSNVFEWQITVMGPPDTM